MLRDLSLALCVVLATAMSADAGKYNPVLSIGDKAPAWTKLPGVDGKTHSLSDHSDAKAIVLVFTCNSCPYAVDYEDRLIALTKQFANRNVRVVAVNVNKIPEDNFEAMQERAKTKKFNFPYLFDATQQIAKDYGATYTPEFFVIGPDRTIAYMGALDDSPNPKKVKVQHVAAALTRLLNNQQPELTETIAIGCRIRVARPRRTKKP